MKILRNMEFDSVRYLEIAYFGIIWIKMDKSINWHFMQVFHLDPIVTKLDWMLGHVHRNFMEGPRIIKKILKDLSHVFLMTIIILKFLTSLKINWTFTSTFSYLSAFEFYWKNFFFSVTNTLMMCAQRPNFHRSTPHHKVLVEMYSSLYTGKFLSSPRF